MPCPVEVVDVPELATTLSKAGQFVLDANLLGERDLPVVRDDIGGGGVG